MPPARQQTHQPLIRVAPLGELNANTVYDHELETLAQGSPAGLLLNFALALLPLAGGIIVKLRSSTMTDLNFTLFTSAAIIFIIAGLICLVLWWWLHTSVRAMVQTIKNRMPPQGILATAPAAPPAASPAPAAPPSTSPPPTP